MAVEHHDWVDRAMAENAWEPPAGFTDRVVLQSIAVLPRRVSFRESVAATLDGLRTSLLAQLEGSVWVIRQYRDLILHS